MTHSKNNINNELYQMSLRQMSKHELIYLLTDRDNQIKQLHKHIHNILQNCQSNIINKNCVGCDSYKRIIKKGVS